MRRILRLPRHRLPAILALLTAPLPGQPPHETKPIISAGPRASNAPLPSLATLKSVDPGHKSSVCWHLIIPIFMIIAAPYLSPDYRAMSL